MPIEIETSATVTVSAKEFVEQCGIDDVACFATYLAEKLDQDFVNRAYAAEQFAEGLSETGARWLAEVLASFYLRQRR
jgi:hypothetical protein